jgi:hypothetical protein
MTIIYIIYKVLPPTYYLSTMPKKKERERKPSAGYKSNETSGFPHDRNDIHKKLTSNRLPSTSNNTGCSAALENSCCPWFKTKQRKKIKREI